MKQSLANLRLRELSWDALDLSILENNAQLGTWIQVLFSRRMKKFSGLTASKCQSAFCPKINSQDLGVLLHFQVVCLFICCFRGKCCCWFCLLTFFQFGVVVILIDCLVVFVWLVFMLVWVFFLFFLWSFFGDWVFYLSYKVICIVQAGCFYMLLFLSRDNVSVTFTFCQALKSSVQIIVSLSMFA